MSDAASSRLPWEYSLSKLTVQSNPMDRRTFLLASSAAALSALRTLAQPTPTLFIDSHVHVWKHSPDFPFAPGVHPTPEDASVETLLSLMRANSVARTVLIQVIHYRWDNRYLAAVLKRYPASSTASAASIPKTPPPPTISPALPKKIDSTASALAPPPRLTETGFAARSCLPSGFAARSSKFP